jgi:hypothetical protein
MPAAARYLLTGLLAGLFLALLVPQFVTHLQLPTHTEAGPTLPLSHSESMAQALRNIVRRGAGGYKKRWVPPTAISVSSITCTTPKHFFSTTSTTMSSTKTFIEAVKERRTIYQLNKEAPISDKQISEIAEKAILHVPSSFNSQSTRLVVLLNKDHETFWDFVLEVLKPLTPEEKFPQTEQKINGFKGAYGTVSPLFVLAPFLSPSITECCRIQAPSSQIPQSRRGAQSCPTTR